MLHAHVHWGARILYPRVLCTRAIYPRRFVHSFARIHKREAFVEPCKSSARCTNTGARSTFARTRTLFSPSSFPRSLSSFNRTTQPRRVSRSPSPLFNSPPPAHAASLSFSLSLSLYRARARFIFPSPSLLFARLVRLLSDMLGVPRTHRSAPPNRPVSLLTLVYLSPSLAVVRARISPISVVSVHTRALPLFVARANTDTARA